MTDESHVPDGATDSAASAKVTAAGALIALVTTDSVLDLPRLARALAVPERQLRECRDGQCGLSPEVQMLLAAYIMEWAPQHSAAARRLHAYAKAALHVPHGVIGLSASTTRRDPD